MSTLQLLHLKDNLHSLRWLIVKYEHLEMSNNDVNG